MKQLFFILSCLVLFFAACKKEDKTQPDQTNSTNPVNNNPNSTADFTLTASDINYPVGSTWAYDVLSHNYQYVNVFSSSPSLSYDYTTSATYTVSIIRDTMISPTITGKILLTAAAGIDNINNYIREVWYYEPADMKWHDIIYERYSGGPEMVACLGINLPLTNTSSWQNTHTSHPSTGIDSCFAKGFDNVSCGLGVIKCIKFENKYFGTQQNKYWYNNIYGRVRTEGVNYETVGSTITAKASTVTLTSFHN